MKVNDLLLLVLVVPGLVAAQGAGDLYLGALDALKRNDCKVAIDKLEKYKAATTERLKQQPSFAKAIDKQITECKRFLNLREGIAGSYVGASAPSARGTKDIDFQGLELR